jgi:hypothetical protein
MKNPVFITEVIVNVEYGGFSIDRELLDWMVSKGCKVFNDEKKYEDYHKNHPSKDLCFISFSKDSWAPYSDGKYIDRDDLFLRTHKDLIKGVKALKKKHGDSDRRKVLDLKVVKVQINLEVVDYNDGKEYVLVNGHEYYE